MTMLTHAEGTDLLPALVSALAADAGVRTLLIKGQATSHHGFREPTTAVDVDFLVDPAGYDTLKQALAEAGWSQLDHSQSPRFVEGHSDDYQHELWPVAVDLHHHFPGFLRPADEVFEALWNDGTDLSIAGCSIRSTGQAGTALIGILHGLRNPDSPKAQEELTTIAGWLHTVDAATGTVLTDLAQATGSYNTALAAAAADVFPHDPEELADPADLLAWERQQTRRPDGISWVSEFDRQPVYRWPGLLVRAVLGVDEHHLRVRHPKAPPGRRGLWLARWWRLKDGLRALPKAVLVYWRHRRPRP